MILRTVTSALAAGVLALSLGGCGSSDADPGPGGITQGEAEALDKAAAMLDERRVPDDLVPDAQATAPLPPEAGTPNSRP